MAKSQGEKKEEAESKKKPRIGGGKGEEKGEERTQPAWRTLLFAVIPIALAVLLFFFAVLPAFSVPFSTFKANYLAAPRVAIVTVDLNASQFAIVSSCATQIVQVTARSRNATTIDFYVLNQTRCIYPAGGLGHTLSLLNNTIGYCINATKSEPTIFMNYSAVNRTVINAGSFYIYGNAQYFSQCPAVVDLS